MNATEQLQEIADQAAIRKVIDEYAYCADSRDAKGQMALFTEDTHFVVFMDSKSETPTQELHSRAELAPVFDNLNTYKATMHFNGQSAVNVNGDKATGITYCMAHHLSFSDKKPNLMVAAIRYLDTFRRQGENWFFAERRLMVDWIENR